MNIFQDPPHRVPLERAAEKGHTQTVEKLLEGKACVNHQNNVSVTVQCMGEFWAISGYVRKIIVGYEVKILFM